MTQLLDLTEVTGPGTAAAGSVMVRRMTRDDSPVLDAVFAGLSGRSRFLRYHAATPRLTRRMRTALLDLDGRRHVALVAEVGPGDPRRAVGIARLIDLGDGCAEVAVEVVDAWHRRGVGTRLLESVAHHADLLGYVEFHADVLPENLGMRLLLTKVFPDSEIHRIDGTLRIGHRVRSSRG